MVSSADAVAKWAGVADAIEDAIVGLKDDQLDLRGGPDDWSIRETVHHLVEANLVASTIVLAALGAPGSTYDWSWLNPDRSWMKRTGYITAPVGPALETLRSLCVHVAGLLRLLEDPLTREVQLLDAPGAALRSKTDEQVLQDAVDHVVGHLRDLRATRTQHSV